MIPPAWDKRWLEIVNGKRRHEFEFMAAKFFLTRWKRLLVQDNSPANLTRCAQELRALFVKNHALPSAQRDLKRLFG